jgi:hypothetical protein
MIAEADQPASPYGVLARARQKVSAAIGGGNGASGD